MTTTPAPEAPPGNAYEIGWLFVQEYYTMLNRKPQNLHLFYSSKNSVFVHGNEGESGETVVGKDNIQTWIKNANLNDCKVLVSNVDSQASFNNGIVVQVLGEMSNNGGPHHKFAQTFFLAPQTGGYYLLNDIFRFLKEDIDGDYNDLGQNHATETQPVQTTTQTQTAAAEHHHVSTNTFSVLEREVNSVPAPIEKPVVKKVEAGPARAPSPAKHQPAPAKVVEAPATPKSVPVKEAPAHTAVDEKKKSTPPAKEPKQESKKNQKKHEKQQQAAPAAVPSEPPKPKSWASMAAASAPASNGPSVSPVPSSSPAKPKTAPAAVSATVVNGTAPAPVTTQDKKAEDSKPKSPEEKDGFREVQSRKRKEPQQNADKQAALAKRIEKEKLTIYVRNVPEDANKDAMASAFGTVGLVTSVDIFPEKKHGFVTYADQESVAKALGKTFVVDGVELVAEERRRTTRPYFNNGHQNGRGGFRGGRGGFKKDRPSSGPAGQNTSSAPANKA